VGKDLPADPTDGHFDGDSEDSGAADVGAAGIELKDSVESDGAVRDEWQASSEDSTKSSHDHVSSMSAAASRNDRGASEQDKEDESSSHAHAIHTQGPSRATRHARVGPTLEPAGKLGEKTGPMSLYIFLYIYIVPQRLFQSTHATENFARKFGAKTGPLSGVHYREKFSVAYVDWNNLCRIYSLLYPFFEQDRRLLWLPYTTRPRGALHHT